jgi:MFS family permease
MYVLSLVDRQIIALMVSPLRRDLGLSDVQVGLLEGFAFVLMYTLAAFPLGWAVDRFSRRWVMFVGIIVWSVSCAAAGFASSFAGLFASRVGVGVGEAALSPAAHSILSSLFPRRRLSLALGGFVIGANIGVIISYGVGGWLLHWLSTAGQLQLPLLGAMHPWQAAFVLAGVPGILLCWLLLTIPEPHRGEVSSQRGAFLGPLWVHLRSRGRSLWWVFFGFSFNNLLGYSILSWTPAYLERAFAWNAGQIGPALGALLGGSGIAGMLSAGAIADYFFRRGVLDATIRISAAAMLTAIPLMLAAFLAPTPRSCLLFLALSFFCTSFTVPNAACAVQLIAPNHLRGRLAASYIFVSNIIGQGLGPLAVGFVTEHFFGSHLLLGRSLATVLPAGALIGALLLLIGRDAFRSELEEVERVRNPNFGTARYPQPNALTTR